jgi:hypothetical protein
VSARRSRAGAASAAATSAPSPHAPPSPLFPGARDLFDWRGPFLIPLIALLAARILYAYFIPVAAEDAYITFRYARNFATGHGLVFNPGERVMGFTSPLWTMWMALGLALHAPPVAWARGCAMLADAVTLVVIAGALRRTVSNSAAFCFAAFFAAWPYFPAIAASGMESSLVLALLALSASWVARRHPAAIVALAALAVSRPEGAAVALLLALVAKRRDALLAIALAAALLAPFAIYYHTLIPQSLLAKSQVYGTPGPLAGRIWWSWLIPRPYQPVQPPLEQAHLVAFALLLTPAAIAGAIRMWAARREAIALFAFGALSILAGYALLGVAYFYWYLLVPLAGLAVFAAAGLPEIVRGRWLYASLAVYLAFACRDGLTGYFARANVEYEGFGAVASYLFDHASPGEKAFLEPIGMIGFQCPLVIVDEVGLVSPAVARRRLEGAGWYADIVERERPDWLITRAGLLREGQVWAGAGAPFRAASEPAAILERYAIVDTVAAERGAQAFFILRRR